VSEVVVFHALGLHQLGRHVLEFGDCEFGRGGGREGVPEVADLHVVVARQEYVVHCDVSVQDSVIVQIFDAQEDLGHEFLDVLFFDC